ncbi:hypothetical protein C8046_14515 [Serinibacter arcticus]|uniref:beta-galactosidase n=1 Tax=Serinibacter arcticus TaxID=1655435 RepID=A0A2U1ZXG4_9MICO|nr:Ig-like domain-containing protein [Serinibacter arcticus]PWD51678.1 hypothetical protein C8046_14515 [Serinibacter arcticus]
MQLDLPWGVERAPVLDADTEAPEVVETDADVTLTGDDFELVIDKITGLITSFVADGEELLLEGPTPDFWRPSTQNDVRNSLAARTAPWREAGRNVAVEEVTITETEAGTVNVQLTGSLPTPTSPEYRLGYIVTSDGEVVIRSTMAGESQLAELPAMGTALVLPGEYDNVTWLGRGPGENWNDRNFATTVGLWESTVDEQVYPFPIPQATGHHTDVRWATLTNEAGSGLLVGAVDEPIQFAALPYSEAEITDTSHHHDLEADGNVHLAVDGAQQGLGHQWGSPALPKYTLQSRDAHSFEFLLRPITAADDVNALARRTIDLDLLSSITVDGQPIETFHTDVTDYTITFSGAIERDVPVVAAAPASDGVEITVTQSEDIPGTATVTATSADGVSSTTYEIHFEEIQELYLSDIDWLSATIGFGTIGRDANLAGQPIRLRAAPGETTYPKGIGTHANSSIVYDVSQWDFNRFSTVVGIEQSASSGGRPFQFRISLDGQVAWTSPSMTKETPGLPVELDIEGVKQVKLDVTFLGANNGHGHAAWADAKLWSVEEPEEPGEALQLSDIGWQSASSGYLTTSRDQTVDGKPLQVVSSGTDTVTFEKGLGVHANSSVVYDLTNRSYATLAGTAGVGRNASQDGNLFVFSILVDGEEVWSSGQVRRSTPAKPFELDIAGAARLELRMTAVASNSHGHGVWGSARLEDPIDVAPTAVTVTPGTATLSLGATTTLAAAVAPAEANQAVTWTSSDPTVATVGPNGLVTARKAGTAVVTAASAVDGAITGTATITVTAIVPTSLTVTPASASIVAGTTTTLTAQALPAEAVQAVEWSSSDTSVLTVSPTGVVTGREPGTATITASSLADPSRYAEATVRVTGPVPATVAITPASSQVVVGATVTLAATVAPATAEQSVTWSVSDPAVATVSAAGVVSGLRAGTVTVTAASDADPARRATATVVVRAPAPTAVTVTPTATQLEAGATAQLSASIAPAAADQAVTWRTSDAAVATVDAAGLVTALAAGTAEITATSVADGTKAASATVTVTTQAPPAPTAVTVTPTTTTLEEGDSTAIVAAVLPAGAVQTVTWSSSDAAVATVDATGVVTALRAGTATVTATSTADGTRSAGVAVTVTRPAPTSVVVAPTSLDLTVGAQAPLTATVLPAAADQAVTWVSSDETVATVTAAGVVTARAAGTATVTARSVATGVVGDVAVTVTEAASPFLDVASDNLFYAEIVWLFRSNISTGWVDGQGNAEFRPLSPVNRDAMAAFLYRLAGSPTFVEPETSPFVDVAKDNLFYKEISWLHAEGISTGWSLPGQPGRSEFRPLAPVARDAMAAFLARFADGVLNRDVEGFDPPAVSPFVDVTTDNLYYREIAWLAHEGISSGWDVEGQDGLKEFRPLSSINRDAMAKFMFELMVEAP